MVQYRRPEVLKWSSLVVLLALGCGGKTGDVEQLSVAVDPFSTPGTVVGGDLLVTGVTTACDSLDRLEAFADARSIVVAEDLALVGLDFGDGDIRTTFHLPIRAADLPATEFGIPVAFDLTLNATCGGRSATSEVFEQTYLPTVAGLLPGFNPTRFWAASKPGDFLTCAGTDLFSYAGGVTQSTMVSVGFPCIVGELRGFPGQRRFLGATGKGGGFAVVDPGPILLWSQRLNLVSWLSDSLSDPVVVFDEGDSRKFSVLNRDTGVASVGPVTFLSADGSVVGEPSRTPAGDLLFLRSQRGQSLETLSYLLQRFDSAGNSLGMLKMVEYPFRAPSYIATLNRDGSALYATQATDADNRWLAKIDSVTGDVLWQLDPDLGIFIPLGEAPSGRLLAASDDGFYWLDGADGSLLSERFGPVSGNTFLKASIEADESIVMIADASGGLAQGLYIFAPDGRAVVALNGNLRLRWLAGGWGDGPLVSNFDEVHVLHSRQGYDDLADGL